MIDEHFAIYYLTQGETERGNTSCDYRPSSKREGPREARLLPTRSAV